MKEEFYTESFSSDIPRSILNRVFIARRYKLRMKIRILSTLLWLCLGTPGLTDPAAVPGPNPVPDPGRRQPVVKAPFIVEQPADMIRTRSKGGRFYCRAEGYPSPVITWLKDGEPLRADAGNYIITPSGEIVFYRIRSHDEGMYQCVARNSAGEAKSRNSTLRIAYIKEDFRVMPKDTVAEVGGKAIIECDGPRGLPEPTISWKKDGRKIGMGDSRIQIVNGDLVISGARKADSGTYQCVASNDADTRSSLAVLLAVQEPPHFIIRPTDQTVVVGREVELACEAQGDPKPRIRWTKTDGMTPQSRIVPLSNGNLRITNVQAKDEGRYICNAENRLTVISAAAFITVQTVPEFVTFPQDVSARVGTTIVLSCSAAGKPEPTILWHGTDANMFPGKSYEGGHMAVNNDGDLTIYNVQFSDEGQYTCQALSPVGAITASATLSVLARKSNINPPIIRQGPRNRTVVQGQNVELSCTTSAVPTPDLEWTKDGSSVITSGDRFTLTTSGSLKISNIQNSDAGRYTCIATNDFGRSRWDAWIRVSAKGTATTQPNDDITRIPSPPGAPVVVNATSSTVTLRWKPSSYTGASPVTGYILEYYCFQSESATWVRAGQDIPGKSFTVRGLDPSSSYVFNVRAMNKHGVSDPSDVSEAINTLGNYPPLPNDVERDDILRKLNHVTVRLTDASPVSSSSSSGSIVLKWETSANCDIIDGFIIYVQPVSVRDGALIKETALCYARTAELRNLREITIYEIRIQPYKGKDEGSPSPILLASPESEGTSPQAPALKVDTSVPEGDKLASATFSWTSPPEILPQYVKQYTFRCYDKSDAEDAYDLTLKFNGSVTTVTLDDLPRGREFAASLVFSTDLGVGVYSQKQEFSVSAASVEDDSGFSSMLKNPGVLAGIAASALLLIGIVVGIFVYRRYKRMKKNRGLHGVGRAGIPLDPFNKHPQYTKGFTMSLATGGPPAFGEGGNNGESSNNNNMYLQRQNMQAGMTAPPSVARNTTASLNSNGNVGTSLSHDISDIRPTTRHTSSFSYVTDQLTSMSNIPPQFSSPDLARTPTQVMSTSDLQHQFQSQKFVRRASEQAPMTMEDYRMHDPGRDLISMQTPTDAPPDYSTRDMMGLPPPPPSPPMSQKTSLSDRTNRSRGSSKNGTDRSSNYSSGKSRRSRERNRPPLCERIPTDTDTGIDSPQQTPSPPRPTDLLLDHASAPPMQPTRAYAYPDQKPHYPRHSNGRRGDGIALEYNARPTDPSLGYLAGPSEGETESEVDGGRRMRPKNYTSMPEEPRNSVTVSSVSMMNAYDSESDCDSSEMRTPVSSIESLNMESASQVGVNAPQQMLSPRSAHSAFVPIQTQGYENYKVGGPATRPGFVKPKGARRQHQRNGDQTDVSNGHYPESQNYLPPPRSKPQPPPPAHLLNRVNSASSSGSSSYHQNTADSGLGAGAGSYGHNSLNSSSSADSSSKGQMSRSRTTGSLSAENQSGAPLEGAENGLVQFSSVDRRYVPTADAAEYQNQRGRTPAPQPRRPPRMGTGGTSSSKSPQRKDSQDASLSLPAATYDDFSTDDRQPMLSANEFTTNEVDGRVEPLDESRITFLAAKSVFLGGPGGKSARGRHPELSDVPEASTSDFCEDYSDRSQ